MLKITRALTFSEIVPKKLTRRIKMKNLFSIENKYFPAPAQLDDRRISEEKMTGLIFNFKDWLELNHPTGILTGWGGRIFYELRYGVGLRIFGRFGPVLIPLMSWVR